MQNYRTILFACILSSASSLAQDAYTDKGHWIGIRGGYVPSRDNAAYTAMYEYRFDTYWSTTVDLTNFDFRDKSALVIAASLKMRLPILKYNKNLYAQVGFGSGSFYPVLFYAAGFEYGILERISLLCQLRQYTTNFDDLRRPYRFYSLGLNFDITPAGLRQSYLSEH